MCESVNESASKQASEGKDDLKCCCATKRGNSLNHFSGPRDAVLQLSSEGPFKMWRSRGIQVRTSAPIGASKGNLLPFLEIMTNRPTDQQTGSLESYTSNMFNCKTDGRTEIFR